MAKRPTILVLTSRTGGGHVSLAEALREQLESTYNVAIIDPQPRFLHQHYRLVSRQALWLWAAEYRLTDTPARALLAHRLFTRCVIAELSAQLERIRPDLIITTYPFLTYEARHAIGRRAAPVPLVMLFADPAKVHASWLTEQNATVFAPTTETYQQARDSGFAPHRLHLAGWPVRQQFITSNGYCRAELLTRLGLSPDRFTIFVQGGGEGAAQVRQTVEAILQAKAERQVILATGTNAALHRRFSKTPNVFVLPFTKEIAPYMAAADVIMGKAGPNMLFEAVTLGKPFIATASIPGQEEPNLEFIRRHHLGWVALDGKEQRALLARLSVDPAVLQQMAATVAAYRHWNATATATIVPLIDQLIAASESEHREEALCGRL